MVNIDISEDKPFSLELLSEAHSIGNGLANYVELSHEVENLLDQKEKDVGAKLEAALQRHPESDRGDIYDSYAFELRDYESTFRFIQREAMFLSLYTISSTH
jgi:hypothetical protein